MKKSAIYLVIYLGVLIGFAFFYNCLEGQFYHSSIQREPAYMEQQELFKLRLTHYLNNQFRSDVSSQFVIKDSADTVIPLKVKEIVIDKVKQVDDDELLVIASLVLVPIKGKTQQQGAYPYIANVTFSIRNWRIFENDNWMIDNIQIKKIIADVSTPYKEQIEKLRYPLESDPGIKRISFTDSVDMEITRYASATFGQPKSSMDNLLRMFYLSAITITTTGYGDIVPLTNLARFGVATEAFLGITIIGFYLNSVAREIADRRGKNSRGDEI